MAGPTEDGYEYLLEMRDELSAPGLRAAATLDTISRSLLRIDQNTREAAAPIRTLGHGLSEVHGGAHKAASGISYAVRGFDDLTRGGKYAANGLLDVGKAFSRLGPWLAGAAFIGGTAAIAKFAFEVSEAKEQAVAAFDVFQGEGRGEGTFKLLNDLSQSVHSSPEKVQGLAKELLELGLTNNAQIAQTVRAVTDLQRVGLESGARKIESIVERSLAAGHLFLGKGGAGASRALTGTGISEAGLAAQLGLSTKQLEAKLKGGKISVEEGIAAIDNAIIQGKLGALATKKFTVSDAFTDLHTSVRKLFQESDTSPITDSLKRLTESFEDGTDGARVLSDVVDGIFKGVGLAIDGVRDLGRIFGETAEGVLDAWDKVDDFLAGIGKSAADKEQIASQRRLTNAKRLLGEAVDDQSRAFEKVQNLATSGASRKEILDMAKRLGIDVSILAPGSIPKGERQAFDVETNRGGLGALDVNRETAEFSNAYGALRDQQIAGTVGASGRHALNIDEWEPALKNLGKQAGKALHEGAAGPEGLDAHSPSKKMFDLGVDAADGLLSGAMQAAGPTTTNVGGKSVAVHVDVGGIHMMGSVDADEFDPLLESKIADVFERIAQELGT